MPVKESASRSRRSFLQVSAAAAVVAAGFRIVTEPMLAHAESHPFPKDAVLINSNENPLGPCGVACEAVKEIASQGGRYSSWLTDDLIKTFSSLEGLKPEYIRAFPGSSCPLHYTVLAFTSPTKSFVTADPGYEAGTHAAKYAGARVVNVPLAKSYAHDVKAMLAAAPDAGVFYICTPNNPTGTLTSHSDIEFLLANKPKDSILLVDEAYIHFADMTSTLDLVKADKDLVVLRTFSKVYGMAGLRCGFAIARPDLLEKVSSYAGWNAMPITAVAAATASLKDPRLVPERKRINATVREATFSWLSKNGYSFVPSESNCFMLDAKRPAKEMIAALKAQNVFIGRPWPVWPTHVRVTVGTQSEMERFQEAFQRVMSGAAAAYSLPSVAPRLTNLDGVLVPEIAS
ncbi:MAG TPA: pyridoxal phosphate-dependent aminotransferase [Candidatus Methylomirabilis sp.]|nr:pyridoxal phosphate-dependent aminotransferase [Candidatus Methylomirabilis sp.]